MGEMSRWSAEFPSPVGVLRATVTEAGLESLVFAGDGPAGGDADSSNSGHALLRRVEAWLAAYFAGEFCAREFSGWDLPLAVSGTAFQRRCWNYLLTIPPGETRTYLQQARDIGDEKAVRAVGLANGRNPIAIVIPCHRVIGTDGSLTGYGGGIERKQWLLNHEQRSGRLFQLR